MSTPLQDEPIRVMRIIARMNIGGPAIHVALLTKGLNDEAFHSLLVTGVIGQDEGDMNYMATQAGISPIVIPSMQREVSPLADLRTLFKLIRLIRQHRPHVVHTHTAKAGFVGRWAAYLCGVPVIVHTFHGHVLHSYFGRIKTALFRFFETLSADISDVIITLSEGLKEELIAYGIASPNRFRVIPLGLDLQRLANLEDRRGQLRAELACSTDSALVGIIGRLVPVKNHELLLAAARRVLETRPNTYFVIVGNGERRGVLENMSQAMNLDSNVLFIGWRQDLENIYADLDVVVITSHNEGTPVSLIEAMAAGVPVVATAVGGVPDLLQQGALGSLVPPGNEDALAGEIIQVLDAGRTNRQTQAQQWVLEHYSARRLIADMRALYLELLARKGMNVNI